MNEDNKGQQQPIDPNLDVPAEAARTKHINFLDAEDNNTEEGSNADDLTPRQKQWKEGFEEE